MAETIITGIFGIALGYLLKSYRDWNTDHKKIFMTMILMKVELAECQRQIIGLSKSSVISPLHRLPTKAYDELWRAAVQVGNFTESEISAVGAYFHFVEQINRGLDQANSALQNKDPKRAMVECRRVAYKAGKISKKAGQVDDPYLAAAQVIQKHLERANRLRKI